MKQDIPYGYCHCGCGQKTRTYTKTSNAKGYARGEPCRFINGHYARRNPVERFWEKVDKNAPGGCWEWTGSTKDNGYGQFTNRFSGGRWRPIYAHRYAHELLVGAIPEEMILDHLCRNRACVNPEHLAVVNHRENILRGVGVTAENARKTHCKHGHPFNEANTYVRANGWRSCRACNRLRRKT